MVKSPCIDICTIDYEGGVCVGCNRSLEEIANWSSFDDIKKKKILMKAQKNTASKKKVSFSNSDD